MGRYHKAFKAATFMGRMKFALGFSGRIKSGKTTIARRVADELNVPFASFGDYLRTVAAARGLDSSDRTILQDLGQELFESDLSRFCTDVLFAAGWEKGMCVVIDGIRHVQVLVELNKILEPVQLKLVYISISGEVQAQRIKESGSRYSVDVVESHSTEVDVMDGLNELAELHFDGGTVLKTTAARIVAEAI